MAEFPRTINTWPITPSGKRWAETVQSPASPVEELRDDGARVIRTHLTPWETRYEAMLDFLGFSRVVGVGANAFVSRHLPHAYPDFTHLLTGLPFLFCTEIQRCEPLATPPGSPIAGNTVSMRNNRDVARYLLAKFTLVYTTLPYEILADNLVIGFLGLPDEALGLRYVSVLPRPSAQIRPVPLDTFRYVLSPGHPDGASAAVPGQPNQLIPEHDWQITWHRVPTAAVGTRLVNPAALSYPLDFCLGKVNSVSFPPASVNPWPAGTLLLTGAQLRPFRSPFGDRLWDITYYIKAFQPGTNLEFVPPVNIGHNHILRLNPTGTVLDANKNVSYYEVTTTGTTNLVAQISGRSIFDYFDFAKLFRVPGL